MKNWIIFTEEVMKNVTENAAALHSLNRTTMLWPFGQSMTPLKEKKNPTVKSNKGCRATHFHCSLWKLHEHKTLWKFLPWQKVAVFCRQHASYKLNKVTQLSTSPLLWIFSKELKATWTEGSQRGQHNWRWDCKRGFFATDNRREEQRKHARSTECLNMVQLWSNMLSICTTWNIFTGAHLLYILHKPKNHTSKK